MLVVFFLKKVTMFGADKSLFVDIDDKDILIHGKDPIDALDDLS